MSNQSAVYPLLALVQQSDINLYNLLKLIADDLYGLGTGSISVQTSNPTIKTISNTYNLTLKDEAILADGKNGTFNVYLPDARICLGKIYNIKKIDSSGNAIGVRTSFASQLIDGAASVSLAAQYNSILVRSDGMNWWKV